MSSSLAPFMSFELPNIQSGSCARKLLLQDQPKKSAAHIPRTCGTGDEERITRHTPPACDYDCQRNQGIADRDPTVTGRTGPRLIGMLGMRRPPAFAA